MVVCPSDSFASCRMFVVISCWMGAASELKNNVDRISH